MSLLATVEALVAAGATGDMILAVVRVHEAQRDAAAAERREKDAARKQAERVRNGHAESRGQAVTSRESDEPSPHGGGCAQVVTPSSSLRSEAYTPVSPNGLTAPGGAETARGSRLPESWNPDLEAAAQLGLSTADAQVEADKFRDYWRAVPGSKGRKTNWPATWRNWCRTAAERKPNTRKAHDQPHNQQRQPTARDDRLSRMLSGAMAAADGQAPVLRTGDDGARALLPRRIGTGG